VAKNFFLKKLKIKKKIKKIKKN